MNNFETMTLNAPVEIPTLNAVSELQQYKQLIRRTFDQRSKSYARFAFMEQTIGSRLLEQLDFSAINPDFILDLGSGNGHDAALLARRYPQATIIALDHSLGMLAQQAEHAYRLCADAQAIPLKNHCVDLILANNLIPWLPSAQDLLTEVRRVLKPDGLWIFATLGLDTLSKLSSFLAEQGLPEVREMATLMDLHPLGDQLLKAGFSDPIVHMDMLQFDYEHPVDLLRDLAGTGWAYAMPPFNQEAYRDFLRAYSEYCASACDEQGSIAAEIEVIYAHAWGACMKQEPNSIPVKIF